MFGIGKQDPHPCCSQQGVFLLWAIDTVVSSRGKSKGWLATFVECPTHFDVAMKIKNRSATEMFRAIHDLDKHFPKNAFKTSTVGRGNKFACDSKVEAD